MSKFNVGWYLLYTRPRQEARVAKEMADKNIQIYLPYTTVRRRWTDRIKVLEVPLFPSYVFVHLTNMHEFYYGSNLESACSYVRFGNEVARVSDAAVDAVRTIAKAGDNLEVSSERFTPGQQMTIKEGPLCGLNCEVIQYKGKDKILVRVHMLQRSIMADMPANVLIPFEETQQL